MALESEKLALTLGFTSDSLVDLGKITKLSDLDCLRLLNGDNDAQISKFFVKVTGDAIFLKY